MESVITFPSGEYRVARQDFAMDASRVRAILPVRELTPLEKSSGQGGPMPGSFGYGPWLEKWTCGFAALQGKDFPVIDLRAKLGLAHSTHGRQPCIVVVEVSSSKGPNSPAL